MRSLQEHPISHEDGVRAVRLAREALSDFVIKNRRADVGRQEELFYQKIGVFVRLTSEQSGRLRGSAGVYESNDQLVDALLDSVVRAAGESSGGSSVSRSELDSLLVSVALVDRVIVTDSPEDVISIGEHCILVDNEWLYPTVASNNDLSPEEYLTRTYRKAGKPPKAWQDDDEYTVLCRTRLFKERDPRGSVADVTGEVTDTNSRMGFTSYTQG